jgi:hypothetical protein
MPVASDRKPFWKTLPGAVAAIAGFLSAIAGILATAHQLGWIQGIETASNTSTAVLQETTASTESDSDVLFEDDFSDTSSGWNRQNPAPGGGVADYVGSNYRLFVPSKLVYAPGADVELSTEDESRISVETHAINNQGEADRTSQWGVFCRRNSNEEYGPNDYYHLGITGDGRGAISKHHSDGPTERLATSDPTEVIAQGVISNRIRGECVGNSLTLYVNGQELLHAQDEEYEHGDFGLFVDGGTNQGTDITFSDFKAERP